MRRSTPATNSSASMWIKRLPSSPTPRDRDQVRRRTPGTSRFRQAAAQRCRDWSWIKPSQRSSMQLTFSTARHRADAWTIFLRLQVCWSYLRAPSSTGACHVPRSGPCQPALSIRREGNLRRSEQHPPALGRTLNLLEPREVTPRLGESPPVGVSDLGSNPTVTAMKTPAEQGFSCYSVGKAESYSTFACGDPFDTTGHRRCLSAVFAVRLSVGATTSLGNSRSAHRTRTRTSWSCAAPEYPRAPYRCRGRG